MNEKPDESLTIACISIVGGTALFNCISSVLQSGLGCMVIAEERDIIDEVTRLISDKHLELVVTHGDSVPGKRAIAVRKAASAWIAMIEDTCTVNEEWRRGCASLIDCKDAAAGSGPVLLGDSLSVRARALYCSDYGKYFPVSLQDSMEHDSIKMYKCNTLPGVNLLYRRETVMQYINADGLIESEVNRRMIEDGHTLYIHEDLAVTLDHADETGATLHSRFNHGRLYGGLQSRNMRPAIRMVRALTCVLLPFVLSYRSLRAYARVRNRNLVTSLYIILFETVWSCGECTGYLSGCGHSLEDWK